MSEAEEGERIGKDEVVKDEQGDEEPGFLLFIGFASGTNQHQTLQILPNTEVYCTFPRILTLIISRNSSA